jgi:hypothetical protein
MSPPKRPRHFATLNLGLWMSALGFSVGAYGQTPLAASYSIGAGLSSNYPAIFTNVSSSLSTPGYVSVGPGCLINAAPGGCGFAGASLSPGSLDVSISGYGTGTSEFGPEANADADATVNYYVLGPGAAYTPVPMIWSGTLSESVSGAASVGAVVTASTDTGYLSAAGSLSSSTTPFLFSSANGFFVYSSSASTGTYNSNNFTVGAEGQAYYAVGSTAGQFSAEIDPTLEIDPSWLAENPGYSLVFSSNYSPVPLPASVWMMLSGLAGLALMGRRRILPQQ